MVSRNQEQKENKQLKSGTTESLNLWKTSDGKNIFVFLIQNVLFSHDPEDRVF